MTSLASMYSKSESKRKFLNAGGGEMINLVSSINSMKSMLPNYDEASSFSTRKTSVGGPLNVHGEMPKAGRSVRKLNIKDLPDQLKDPSIIPYPEVLTKKKNAKNKSFYDIIGTDFQASSQFRGKSETVISNMQKGKKVDSLAKEIPGLKLTKQELENRKKLIQTSRGASPATFGARKTEATINALSKKINAKKSLWETEQFGWDGYHYSPGKGVDPLNLSRSVTKKAPRNKILEEMSRKFRDSLGINTDMNLSIRTPVVSDHALFQSLEGASVPKSRQKDTMNPQQASPGTSAASSEETLSYRGNPIKKPVIVGRSQQTTLNSRNKPKKTNSDTIKLKTLLLGSSSGESSPRSDTNSADASKTLSYDQLKLVTAKMSHSPRQKPGGNVSKGTASSPRKALDTSGPLILAENFYNDDDSGQAVSGRGDTRRVQQVVKERLVESVKSVDEAAMVATRLGTLLTKLNMAKGSDNSNSRSMKDTVDLAKELRQLATEMEKEYSSLGSDNKSGETQTEKSQELMPQIKFTRDMSYTDQLVLRKLREIREKRTKVEAAGTTASAISPKRKDV